MNHLILFLFSINVVTFVAYGIDKWKARRGAWRISETMLLALAACGGSIGAWGAMRTFHHKTLHKKFKYGVPAILLLQTAATIYLLIRNHP